MTVIYLALGSNVGDSTTHIQEALKLLSDKISNIQSAPMYISKAVGYTDQPDFYNTAAYGETNLSPAELLKFVKIVEESVGRVKRFRWGPREIDVDIIFYDDTILETETLTIPHPRFNERDFVLRPLCDIAPDFVDPTTGKTIQQLLSELGANEASRAKLL